MKLIGYLSNAYPTFEKSCARAELYRKGGMDTVQIDFPADNPYLEGDRIAARMRHALSHCRDWNAYMENISSINRSVPGLSLILLAYDSTINAIGVERFIRFCEKEELPDVTYIGNRHPEVKERLIAAGIRISCYVQFHLDPHEVKNAENSNGFVYLQARPTIAEEHLPLRTLGECIGYLRKRIDSRRRIYTGVGLRTPEDVVMARDAGSDGAFIGSTIMENEGSPESLLETIRSFVDVCREGQNQ